MDISQRTREQENFITAADTEEIPCNLCGRDDVVVLGYKDCIGLPVRTVLCRACGLVYINPRLTREWYGKYYSSMDTSRRSYKHGRESPKEKLGYGFDAARRHGRALGERLAIYLKAGVTIDVGSAEGGVLAGMREVLDIQPIGIEPTLTRAEFAREQGIPTHALVIENIAGAGIRLPRAANIVSTKSLNHMLDPSFFLTWAHATLEEDGRLVLEVKNFRHQCAMSGRIEAGVQIDHPFMFVPETLAEFVTARGFEIVFLESDETKSRREILAERRSGLPTRHIRLVARRLPGSVIPPFSPRPDLFRTVARSLRPWTLYLRYLLFYAQPMRNMMKRARGR